MSLEKKRNQYNLQNTVSELVPWMTLITDSIVVNKDGSLMAVFDVGCVDVEGHTDVEIDTFARSAEMCFRELSSQMAVWSIVDRKEITSYLANPKFSNPVSQMVDDCWKDTVTRKGYQYRNHHYLCLVFSTKLGIGGILDRIRSNMHEGGESFIKALASTLRQMMSKSGAFIHSTQQLEAFIAQFEGQIDYIKNGLADFDVTPLSGDKLRAFLFNTINPGNEQDTVRESKLSPYLDTYLPASRVVADEESKLLCFDSNEKYWSAVLSIKDWPEATQPGIIDNLLSIPAEIKICQVFRYVDDDQAESFIQRVEKNQLAQVKPITAIVKETLMKEESNQINSGRLQLAEDAQDALRELTAERKRYGYYNLTVCCFGRSPEEAEYAAKMVSRSLRFFGFISVRESFLMLSCWAGTIPGQWGEILRWHFVNIANVADMVHFRTFHTGDSENKHYSEIKGERYPSLTVLPTEYATPFYFNFHNGDLAHTFVIGPSGGGKSIICNFLISQFRKYPKTNVYIFDKDYSCLIPTLAQGGKFLDLLGEKLPSIKLNPLRFLDSEEHWPWIKSWLEILLSMRGVKITSEDDDDLWRAIKMTASQPRENRTLSTLAIMLSQKLKDELKIWTGDNQFGKYFDNKDDEFELSDFVAIEMGGLFQNPVLAIAFLEYAFYSIMQKLDGTPTLIEIEECWFMLSFPHLADRIRDWLKTFRKKEAFLVMASQSLDDLSRSEIFPTIIDSIPTRIYLPNADALAHYELYKDKFGLNSAQIDRIRTGRKKMQYYIVQPAMSRMVEAKFPPRVIAVLRSNIDAINKFLHYHASGKSNWVEQYIEEESV